MKTIKTSLFLSLIFSLFFSDSYSQDLLPEVVVSSIRYKYLSAVDNRELPQPVKLLEWKASVFDVKNPDFYDDEYDEYYISFYLPQGYILATYNKDGKLLRTAERYKNVALPHSISMALVKKYPDRSNPKDYYLVSYQEESGATKIWKVMLRKGDKRVRVKLNEKGEYISHL